MIKQPANTLAVIAAIVVVLAVYVLRLNNVAGLMVDDGWYLLLARALAEGRGYRLISSATSEIFPLYPPGLPAMLSLIFRLWPDFPQNVWLLKSVSVAAMLGVAYLSFLYLHDHRRTPKDLALCTAAAIALTPAFVFLATSTLMSECLFTCFQLAGVVLLHRSVESPDGQRGSRLAIAAAISASAAVLVRSAGIALVVASVLWLAKARHWKSCALFVSVAAVCLVPWTLYKGAHLPSESQRIAHGGAVVYDYTDQLWMRWAGSPSFGRATVADLPARVGTNLIDVFARDMTGIFAPALLRGSAESGEEVVALGGKVGLTAGSMGGSPLTMAISLLLSGVVVFGYVVTVRQRLTVAELLVPISLVITLLWPFWSFRFVLPLTPFLYAYWTAGIRTVARGSARTVRIAVLCFVGLNLTDHAGYLLRANNIGETGQIPWLADAERVDAALLWMKTSLPQNGVLASTNPGLVYMRTDRKGIALDDPFADPEALKKQGITYLASLIPRDLPPSPPWHYRLVYGGEPLWVIELK